MLYEVEGFNDLSRKKGIRNLKKEIFALLSCNSKVIYFIFKPFIMISSEVISHARCLVPSHCLTSRWKPLFQPLTVLYLLFPLCSCVLFSTEWVWASGESWVKVWELLKCSSVRLCESYCTNWTLLILLHTVHSHARDISIKPAIELWILIGQEMNSFSCHF